MLIADIRPPFSGYVQRAECQADAACHEDATMIHVAGAGQEPKAWTVLSCTAHVVAARKTVSRTTSAIVFSYRLAEQHAPDPLQVIVMQVEADSHGLLVEGDEEGDEVLWGNGDLIVACPWPGCENSTDNPEHDNFEELDQSDVRVNTIYVEDAWITVHEGRDGRDMHTIGYRCGACENPVEFPDSRVAQPVWA